MSLDLTVFSKSRATLIIISIDYFCILNDNDYDNGNDDDYDDDDNDDYYDNDYDDVGDYDDYYVNDYDDDDDNNNNDDDYDYYYYDNDDDDNDDNDTFISENCMYNNDRMLVMSSLNAIDISTSQPNIITVIILIAIAS